MYGLSNTSIFVMIMGYASGTGRLGVMWLLSPPPFVNSKISDGFFY